ncbi:MAG: hypothetical protein AAFZ87_02705 [Planctomycetota bacterium]
MPELAIEIGPRRLLGFKSLEVSTSLSQAAAKASFDGSRVTEGAFSVAENVRVTFDGQVVFTGALDEIVQQLSSDGLSFSGSARSRSGDLVDSDVDTELVPSELENTDVVAVIESFQRALEPSAEFTDRLQIPAVRSERLARPLARIERLAPSHGDSYWDAIQRACGLAGVIATASAHGGLELLEASSFESTGAALREGVNVLSASTTSNWAERTHFVIAEGQGSSLGSDYGENMLVRGAATDFAIRPTRARIVKMDGAPTAAECAARAEWEAQNRAARGTKVTVVTPGWTIPGSSELWRTGTTAQVGIPSLNVDAELLVNTATYRYDGSGISTQLDFVRPDLYAPIPTIVAEGEPTWNSWGGNF